MNNPDVAVQYLTLLKRTLVRANSSGQELWRVRPRAFSLRILERIAATKQIVLARECTRSLEDIEEGRGWPANAETMMGLRRLDHLESCIRSIVQEGIPGDLFEGGVWRGGALVFMRAALIALGQEARRVWGADSFEGYPPAHDGDTEADAFLHQQEYFRVSQESVEQTLAAYGFSGDPRVQLLKGWFRDSLPVAEIDTLALIRIDVDGYDGTRDILTHLYPKLSNRGFVVVEDFRENGCRKAVLEYLQVLGNKEALSPIPQRETIGVWWRKMN